MKKTLITLLSLLLVAVIAVTFVACGGEKVPEKKDPVSQYKAKGEWATLNDPLSWEDLNAFPIKSSDMSIEDARKLCVDFFRYTKTACWIPDDNFSYFHNNEHTNALEQTAGVIYGGLPYIYVSSGSIYRLMDFMDEEKGVVNIKGLTVNPHLYGNQCSIGAYWGWARVINSADYKWTQDMVESNGFLRVGPYTYDLTAVSLSDTYRTTTIVAENGEQTMYESYALLKAGDGIVYMTTAGHVVMIASDAVVVRNDDGTINGDESYVTVIDQTSGWTTGTNAAGDTYNYEKNVDAKWTFKTLLERYIPFTYAEWLGTDPIEDTEIKVSHTGEAMTSSDLYKTKVTCNYGLSDIYAMVYDKAGNEVFKTVTRAGQAGIMELKYSKSAGDSYTWGSLEELAADGEYTIKLVVQVGTGERPTVYEGKFTV